MGEEKKKSRTDIEWENRTLCSDPACIGVIGPDGQCKECGKPYTGNAFEESTFDPVPDDPEPVRTEAATEAEDVDSIPSIMPESDGDTPSDDEWEQRTLCSDPACIGVIGPDRRCKECGKPYEG